jgi:tetratricopeptide (TPR) repeat protein
MSNYKLFSGLVSTALLFVLVATITPKVNAQPQKTDTTKALIKSHWNLGGLYLQGGKLDDAIAEFTKATQMDPLYDAAFLYRGVAYKMKGENDKALSDFTKIIEIGLRNDPYSNIKVSDRPEFLGISGLAGSGTTTNETNYNFRSAYFMRGSVYYIVGKFENAIADYTKLIEMDLDNSEAFLRRAAAYSKKGQHEKAISDCNKVIQIDPSNYQSYYNKGVVLERAGRKKEAIEAYMAAIEHVPPTDKSTIKEIERIIDEIK